MAAEFKKQRDQIMLFVGKIPSSQYWDVVRIRYGGPYLEVTLAIGRDGHSAQRIHGKVNTTRRVATRGETDR